MIRHSDHDRGKRSLIEIVQIGFGVHEAFYSMGVWVPSRDKAAEVSC
jgi:hypothetical protein